MASRKHRSNRERERLFNLHSRRCYLCRTEIQQGEFWELEHVIPWELTRDESDANVRPAHVHCHKVKSADDIRGIRKADRQRQKHLGIARSSRPMDGGKHSRFKRKVSGEVVLR